MTEAEERAHCQATEDAGGHALGHEDGTRYDPEYRCQTCGAWLGMGWWCHGQTGRPRCDGKPRVAPAGPAQQRLELVS